MNEPLPIALFKLVKLQVIMTDKQGSSTDSIVSTSINADDQNPQIAGIP